MKKWFSKYWKVIYLGFTSIILFCGFVLLGIELTSEPFSSIIAEGYTDSIGVGMALILILWYLLSLVEFLSSFFSYIRDLIRNRKSKEDTKE